MKPAARSVMSWLCCGMLAAVFLWASVPKLLDPGRFAADIENYRVLPDGLIGHAALFVPVFELIVGLGLLWPRYQRGAALLATAMLLVFSVAMAQARMRGIDLSCGCFGAAFEAKVSWWTVLRSGTLALIAVLPLLMLRSDSRPARSRPAAGSATLSDDA
jgi:putative oxidoreductase